MDLEFYKAGLPCHHKITVVVHYIAGKPESILCDWSLSVSMHKTLWGIYLSFLVHLLSFCFLSDPPCSCSLVRSIPRMFVEPFLALLLQSVNTSVVVDHKLHLIWDVNRRAPWEYWSSTNIMTFDLINNHHDDIIMAFDLWEEHDVDVKGNCLVGWIQLVLVTCWSGAYR